MKLKSIKKKILLYIINHFLSCNYFWNTKNKLLRSAGMNIGKNVRIVGPLKIDVCSNLTIGDNTWIGKNFVVNGNADVFIGKNCDIAPDVICQTGTHNIGSHLRRAGNGYCTKIVIEDGCWIGVRSIILPGVNIGSGCIVAAGAVVTKTYEKDLMIGGVPSRVIKEL